MCIKVKILKQTKTGTINFCAECSMYKLNFGHFTLEFTENELNHFGIFLIEIDIDYWESQYCHCAMKRKIPIATLQQNLYLMLNKEELEELKSLVFFKEGAGTMELLPLEKIAYNLILN